MQKFGRLPVLLNGRIKPLDTVARNSLLIIHGKQTLQRRTGNAHRDGLAGRSADETQRSRSAKDFRHPQSGNARRPRLDAGGWQIFFLSRTLPPRAGHRAAGRARVKRWRRNCVRPFSATSSSCLSGSSLYHRLQNSLEITGTTDFKSQIDDLVKNIHPVAGADEKRDLQRKRCKASGSWPRPAIFIPSRPSRLTTIHCNGARWAKASSHS